MLWSMLATKKIGCQARVSFSMKAASFKYGVDRARLTTCIKLIMASVRYQRFCDGHLGEVIKSGHITAVLRKLKQLADARLENTKVD
jgi:hypothetical protein